VTMVLVVLTTLRTREHDVGGGGITFGGKLEDLKQVSKVLERLTKRDKDKVRKRDDSILFVLCCVLLIPCKDCIDYHLVIL